VRIITEEEVLLKELKGYDEYVKKTRYRLVPGIW
jgi:protein-S-isoprenylcysteine O-methyltransferase Ste14